VDLDGEAGKVMFDGVRISWHLDLGSLDLLSKSRPGVEVFDADRVGTPIMLRHWQFGDRFQPIGMADSVKMQDFLANLKIPRVRRHELVLASGSQGEVFWVQGARISERFKLTPRTIRRLHWSWQKL
jgi:tRNA(Ile)-lysidine synthase